MPERQQIRKEAIARQGTLISDRRREFFIEGDKRQAKFQMGEEGLVHWATEQRTGVRYRFKCFWEPDDVRLQRSRYLVSQELARQDAELDVLGGAPFALLETIGGVSRFALLMKNIAGRSWKDLRQDGENSGVYPPPDWPAFKVRLLWAYALARAVEKMEARNFVHADLSDGNVVLLPDGARAGQLALVDFDAYFNPVHPSNYRGTHGFVAPEIWNHGVVGVGSDRVAMVILIQDFLLAGDPELCANDAFSAHYTQDQICALQCSVHPLLRHKYAAVADLVEATLKAPTRDRRPSPEAWRSALRPLFYLEPAPTIRLIGSTGEPKISLGLAKGQKRDLTQTPFSIHADISCSPDGGVYVRAHVGADVRYQGLEGSWRELQSNADTPLKTGLRLFDRGGQIPAHVTIDDRTGLSGPEMKLTLVPESFDGEGVQVSPPEEDDKSVGSLDFLRKHRKKTGFILLLVMMAILLLLFLWGASRLLADTGHTTNVRVPALSRCQSQLRISDTCRPHWTT